MVFVALYCLQVLRFISNLYRVFYEINEGLCRTIESHIEKYMKMDANNASVQGCADNSAGENDLSDRSPALEFNNSQDCVSTETTPETQEPAEKFLVCKLGSKATTVTINYCNLDSDENSSEEEDGDSNYATVRSHIIIVDFNKLPYGREKSNWNLKIKNTSSIKFYKHKSKVADSETKPFSKTHRESKLRGLNNSGLIKHECSVIKDEVFDSKNRDTDLKCAETSTPQFEYDSSVYEVHGHSEFKLTSQEVCDRKVHQSLSHEIREGELLGSSFYAVQEDTMLVSPSQEVREDKVLVSPSQEVQGDTALVSPSHEVREDTVLESPSHEVREDTVLKSPSGEVRRDTVLESLSREVLEDAVLVSPSHETREDTVHESSFHNVWEDMVLESPSHKRREDMVLESPCYEVCKNIALQSRVQKLCKDISLNSADHEDLKDTAFEPRAHTCADMSLESPIHEAYSAVASLSRVLNDVKIDSSVIEVRKDIAFELPSDECLSIKSLEEKALKSPNSHSQNSLNLFNISDADCSEKKKPHDGVKRPSGDTALSDLEVAASSLIDLSQGPRFLQNIEDSDQYDQLPSCGARKSYVLGSEFLNAALEQCQVLKLLAADRNEAFMKTDLQYLNRLIDELKSVREIAFYSPTDLCQQNEPTTSQQLMKYGDASELQVNEPESDFCETESLNMQLNESNNGRFHDLVHKKSVFQFEKDGKNTNIPSLPEVMNWRLNTKLKTSLMTQTREEEQSKNFTSANPSSSPPNVLDRKTSVAQERKTSVAQEEKNSVAQERKTSVAQERKTSVAQEGKPSVAQEGKPSVAQEGKPSVAQEGKPSVAQERKTSVAQGSFHKETQTLFPSNLNNFYYYHKNNEKLNCDSSDFYRRISEVFDKHAKCLNSCQVKESNTEGPTTVNPNTETTNAETTDTEESDAAELKAKELNRKKPKSFRRRCYSVNVPPFSPPPSYDSHKFSASSKDPTEKKAVSSSSIVAKRDVNVLKDSNVKAAKCNQTVEDSVQNVDVNADENSEVDKVDQVSQESDKYPKRSRWKSNKRYYRH